MYFSHSDETFSLQSVSLSLSFAVIRMCFYDVFDQSSVGFDVLLSCMLWWFLSCSRFPETFLELQEVFRFGAANILKLAF